MIPFLDCIIWSVFPDNSRPQYFYVYRTYHHNSITSNLNVLNENDKIQVPENIIQNLFLLEKVDFNKIQTYNIPILRKYDSIKWIIDLTYYEEICNIV
jgi:hypothetical protein